MLFLHLCVVLIFFFLGGSHYVSLASLNSTCRVGCLGNQRSVCSVAHMLRLKVYAAPCWIFFFKMGFHVDQTGLEVNKFICS